MPEQGTLKRARRDKREGKSPSTQAGEFVREEIHHVREGKHGAASAKQAIAIGLSKARRAGVDLPPPKTGSARTKQQAKRESAAGKRGTTRTEVPSPIEGVVAPAPAEGAFGRQPSGAVPSGGKGPRVAVRDPEREGRERGIGR